MITAEQIGNMSTQVQSDLVDFVPAFVQGFLSTEGIFLYLTLAGMLFAVSVISLIVTTLVRVGEDPFYE